MNTIDLSVIIPTYNAKEYLKKCIESIIKSNFKNFEIIVVDNASTDNTASELKHFFSKYQDRITIICLDRNYGPAKARNQGVKFAKGKYLGFLDSDTVVEKNWADKSLKLFGNNKVGAVQCKLLSMKDRRKFDYAGEYLGSLGFLVSVSRHGETDTGQYDNVHRILAAKSAGMFVKKDVFEKIGGFDEDYFIFLEETDLGWRIWLSGYEVIFCPDSVVYHYFSATKDIVDKNFNNFLVRFHGTKNYILTLYKNLSLRYLIKILPGHIVLWICLSGYLFFTGKFNSSLNIMKGIVWNAKNFRKNYNKRKWVQKNRVLSDDQLFAGYGLLKESSIGYYLNKFLLSQRKNVTPENQ